MKSPTNTTPPATDEHDCEYPATCLRAGPHNIVRAAAADATARQGVIRDLYALAAFYVANPEHPLPTQIVAHHRVQSRALLQDVADKHGTEIYGNPDRPRTDFDLPGQSTPTTLVTYWSPR